MTRKFIFLINPVSGTASKKLLPELIAAAAKKYRAHYEILPTVESGDYHFVKQKIREEKFTDVVICGGDGSVNTVVQDVRETGVNFGIVPLGSGNGLAFSAKIPKGSVKALDIIFTGKPSFVDGFLINQSFACMLCGLGFDAQVAHDFAKQKKRGLLTYAQQSLKNFFAAKPLSFEIDLGETKFTTEAYFISIANSNQFGNNFTIAPKASLSDGLLDIVIVKKMNKFMLPFSVLQQVTGINAVQNINDISSKKNIIYFQTPALTVHNNSNAPLHIDGEPKETDKKFEVKIIRNAVKLIQ